MTPSSQHAEIRRVLRGNKGLCGGLRKGFFEKAAPNLTATRDLLLSA
jgi:hypothetical protein